MKKALALILAIVMTMALVACGGKPADTSKPDSSAPDSSGGVKVEDSSDVNQEVKVDETKKYLKNITFGYAQKYTTLDPQETSDGIHDTLFQLYHNSLVDYNYDTQSLEPELAKSWSCNDACNEWTFVLRDDITFSNGEKLTADDVVFTWERGASGSAASASAKMIEKVVADNDYQVTFYLNQATMDWPFNMTGCSASVLNREAFAADPETGYLVGTGGWKVDMYELGIDVTFVKYADSWAWKDKQTPTESLTFRTMTEASARAIAVQTGEIQAGVTPNVAEIPVLTQDPNVKCLVMAAETIHYLAFNCENEKLSDVNLRKAIAYAVDAQEINEIVYEGHQVLAESFWGPGQFGLFTDHEEPLAKEYLAKSNYPNGTELTITASTANFKRVAEVLQSQLADIGIKCTVNQTDSPGLKQIIADNQHEIIVFNKSCGAQGDQFRTILTDTGTNRAQYKNDRVVELLDLAVAEKDEAKRLEMYKEIQQITHKEMPYRTLYYGYTSMLYDAGMSGTIWRPNTKHNHTYVICEERA